MTEWSDEKVRESLKAGFARGAPEEPKHDLWPRMLRRMDAPGPRVSWLDWAVVAVSGLLLLLLPGAAPILFYFL